MSDMTEKGEPVVKRGRLMNLNEDFIEKERKKFCTRLKDSQEFHMNSSNYPTSSIASSELTASESPGFNFEIMDVD